MTTTSINDSINDAGTLPQVGLVPPRVALIALALTVTAIQFSIAVGEIFFGVALAGWLIPLIVEHRRPDAPPWMVPLILYAGWTLVSAAFSPDLATSLSECKQLV